MGYSLRLGSLRLGSLRNFSDPPEMVADEANMFQWLFVLTASIFGQSIYGHVVLAPVPMSKYKKR